MHPEASFRENGLPAAAFSICAQPSFSPAFTSPFIAAWPSLPNPLNPETKTLLPLHGQIHFLALIPGLPTASTVLLHCGPPTPQSFSYPSSSTHWVSRFSRALLRLLYTDPPPLVTSILRFLIHVEDLQTSDAVPEPPTHFSPINR